MTDKIQDLVATEIMGWEPTRVRTASGAYEIWQDAWKGSEGCFTRGGWRPDKWHAEADTPYGTTHDLCTVLEKMTSLGFSCSLVTLSGGNGQVAFYRGDKIGSVGFDNLKKLPASICQAAVQAVRVPTAATE